MALRTLTWDEPIAVSDVIKMEHPTYSRDAITIVSGAGELDIGTVLGKITKGAASSAAKSGGNTGNGTLTLDGSTPVLTNAKVGVYTVRCTAAASNSGTFEVQDPDGLVLGDVAVGATWSDGVKFAIADGSSDFIVGDGFDITVAAGAGTYNACNVDAVNGTQVAVAVLVQKVDATDAAKAAVAVTRFAEVSRHGLKWHANTNTDNERAAAIAQLAAAGIIVREGA